MKTRPESTIARVLAFLLFTTAGSAAAASSGVNDWSCRPSNAHPDPVVLLHGLGGSEADLQFLASYLARADFCVFSLTYGRGAQPALFAGGGVGPLAASAEEIARFVDGVQAATGAPQVDLVGHSEGGLHALFIPKVLGPAREIGKVVTMGTDVHGFGPVQTTELLGLLGLRGLIDAIALGFDCQGCSDILPGSEYRRTLADGLVAQPEIAYTLIFTRFDEAALLFAPLGAPFLQEFGVRNLYVQEFCPLDLVGHALLPSSLSVASLVANALDPAQPVRCGLSLPL